VEVGRERRIGGLIKGIMPKINTILPLSKSVKKDTSCISETWI
jgi:hypothetical protein